MEVSLRVVCHWPLVEAQTKSDQPPRTSAVTTRDSAFFISFYVGCWLSNKHDWGVVCNHHGDDSKSGGNGVGR